MHVLHKSWGYLLWLLKDSTQIIMMILYVSQDVPWSSSLRKCINILLQPQCPINNFIPFLRYQVIGICDIIYNSTSTSKIYQGMFLVSSRMSLFSWWHNMCILFMPCNLGFKSIWPTWWVTTNANNTFPILWCHHVVALCYFALWPTFLPGDLDL